MHVKTASSSQCDRDFVLHLMLCSSALQNKYELGMTSTYGAKKKVKVNNTLHLARSFILDETASFTNTCTRHLLLHSDDITVSPRKRSRDKGREVGLWVVPLSLSLSLYPLHCLNSILHQLVDSVLVDHQGWMKLSSLHQLFKTLKEVKRRHQDIVSGCTDWLFQVDSRSRTTSGLSI